MITISAPRQGGKTTDAIKWLLGSKSRCIVVMNMREADRLVSTYNLSQEQVITWRELKDDKSFPQKEYLIDNADIFLAEYFQREIDAITVSE